MKNFYIVLTITGIVLFYGASSFLKIGIFSDNQIDRDTMFDLKFFHGQWCPDLSTAYLAEDNKVTYLEYREFMKTCGEVKIQREIDELK